MRESRRSAKGKGGAVRRDGDDAPRAADVDNTTWGRKSTGLLNEVHRSEVPLTSLGGRKLLSLQKTAGNRAVAELVAARGGTPSTALGLRQALRHRRATRLPIQRVDTNGGKFDTTLYNKIQADNAGPPPWRRMGADIKITFTPGDNIVSDKIGLTQTVKAMKSTKLKGALATRATARRGKGAKWESALRPGEGRDVGRGIDRVVFATDTATGAESTLPITNPMYGVPNTPASGATPEKVSSALGDTAPGGNAHFGSRKFDPVAKKHNVDQAWLTDTPARGVDMKTKKKKGGGLVTYPAERYELTFETAALVLAGPQENVYLGTVEWGWSSDAAGAVTVKPFSLVSAGAPTQKFMDAARKWNRLKFKDTTSKKKHETVSLPVTSYKHPDAVASTMTTTNLVARAGYLDRHLKSAQKAEKLAGKVKGKAAKHAVERANVEDVINIDFERTVVRGELEKRKIHIDLTATKALNAAAGDDLAVKLSTKGVNVTSAQSNVGQGANKQFELPLKDLLGATNMLERGVDVAVLAQTNGAQTRLFNVFWDLPLRARNTTRFRKGKYKYAVGLSFDK